MKMLFICMASVLSLAALLHAGEAEVKTNDRISHLFVNGKEVVPDVVYSTLSTTFRSFPNVLGKDRNPSAELLKMATDRGFELGTLPLPLVWPKNGVADYSEIDRAIDDYLKINPNAQIFPRLLGMPPAWWLKENPSEKQVWQLGPGSKPLNASGIREIERYATPASKKWQQDYFNALRMQVRHMEKKYGQNIIAYHPGLQSCGENIFPRCWDTQRTVMVGFSEPFRQAFSEFAMKKYGTIDAANRAWGTNFKSAADIRVPTMEERIEGKKGAFRDPQSQRFVIDFMNFFQEPIVDVNIESAKIIKEETNGKKLTLFFFGSPQAGHSTMNPGQRGSQALGKMLKSPFVDIICNPYDYRNRQHGGSGIVGNMIDSIQAHGKMYFIENDTRSHTAPFNHFGKTATMKETLEVHKRLLPQLMQYNLGVWHFDFGSGYNCHEELWDLFKKMNDIRKNNPSQKFLPETVLVFDEASNHYLRGSNEVSRHYFDSMRDYPGMGTTFGRFLFDDVLEGKVPEQTKLLVFMNVYHVSPEQRQQLRKQLENSGKTVLWFYAPGYIDGPKASVENIRLLTGIGVKEITTPLPMKFSLCQPFEGLKAGYQFGVNNQVPTSFAIEKRQPGVTPLATYTTGSEIGMAMKKMDGWNSLLFCGVRMDTAILRAIAKESGAHIYTESGDSVSASENFVGLTALSSGTKHLTLPRKCNITDAFTGKTEATQVKEYEFPMEKGDTRLFILN